jgi:DNA-directed RNA polymerase specialized sigma24 family protein
MVYVCNKAAHRHADKTKELYMSTQCNAAISLTAQNIQASLGRYRGSQRSPATQISLSPQIGADPRLKAAAFERFIYWLGPDAETAGRKYESIRGRLIMMFKARRCVFAEDLADATFERVVRKLSDLTTEFTGDPARYFYGVAKKIYLEYQREILAEHRRTACSLSTGAGNSDLENRLKQLDEALNTIPKSDRELILKYYTGTGRTKINHRRALAEQFGVGSNALRLRVFRIKREIKNYMLRSSADAFLMSQK